jgi:hypothetical protein
MDITGCYRRKVSGSGVIIALSLGSRLLALGGSETSVWVIKVFDYWAFEMNQGYLPERAKESRDLRLGRRVFSVAVPIWD